VLDLGLPDGDGIDFIADMRKWSAVPIIVLSARVDEQDKIRALDAGADDYLTKPFGVGELLARVRATLRRQRQPAASDDGVVQLRRRARRPEGPAGHAQRQLVHMTPTNTAAVGAGENAGRVVTNPQLLREVWGPSNSETAITCASTWAICARSWKPIRPSRSTC
jgi:two-component system KDP operon response regulator KdpE